jgi:outer membrane receptor protein involved in Fe transport
VSGSVTDAAGRPIVGAMVRLASGGAQQERKSDRTGAFAFGGLVPGAYVISANALGYAPLTGRTVIVGPSQTAIVAIRLAVQSASALVSLGSISVNGGEALSRGSEPTVTVNAQALADVGLAQFTQTLAALPGVSLSRPNGGGPGLPVSIALRGSDPKEAVIEIDGHSLNNGNTGDFDVSLFDPSIFASAQVVYGLAPSSLVGADTEGGAMNFRTLEPTVAPHGLARFSLGSFDTSASTLAATGTSGLFGYAFVVRRYNQGGPVVDFPVIDASTGAPAALSSSIGSTDALAKLRYDIGGGGYLEATYLAFSSVNDLSAALSTPVDPAQAGPGQPFNSFAGSSRSTANNWYAIDAQLPLGPRSTGVPAPSTLTLRHLNTIARQSVVGPAADLSEYLTDATDLLGDDSALWDRPLADSDLNLQADVRAEQLTLPDTFGSFPQFQTQRWFAGRYTWNTNERVQYTAALFYSNYSTFGSSVDPRFAVVWSPSPELVVRGSAGTGFQPPSLAERFVPTPLPPPDGQGFINVGNPLLQPDHTTQYELDVEHRFGDGALATRGELDLYRVNQRNDDVIFFPPNASPSNPQLSFPVNVASAVWQGFNLSVDQPLRGNVLLHADYNVNSAYPLAVPPDANDGTFVPGQQYESIPLQRAQLAVTHHPNHGVFWSADVDYEGSNNDLNRPQFATLDAAVGVTIRHTDVVFSGVNLTNVYADDFTLLGAGVPYPGLSGPLPTDAYSIYGRSITFTITQRW